MKPWKDERDDTRNTHGWTWTEPWDEDAAQRHGRNHGTSTSTRARTKTHTERHGRNHGGTSTTTQGANAWMNMDGTMGRRRTQTHKHMDGTMVREQGRRHTQTHGRTYKRTTTYLGLTSRQRRLKKRKQRMSTVKFETGTYLAPGLLVALRRVCGGSPFQICKKEEEKPV